MDRSRNGEDHLEVAIIIRVRIRFTPELWELKKMYDLSVSAHDDYIKTLL